MAGGWPAAWLRVGWALRMDPSIGRAAFRIAFFITFTTLVWLPFLEIGTAEFGVAIMTLVIGLTFIGVIVFLVRRLSN